MKIDDLDEVLRKKVENKQKCITTNSDLSDLYYHRVGRRNDKQRWVFHIPKSKSVEEKINEKQKFIKTDDDLSNKGYLKAGHQKGIQIWIIKSYSIKNSKDKYIKYEKQNKEYRENFYRSERGKKYYREYYISHKEVYDKRNKKWRETHKEKMLEYSRKYRNTPHGKLKTKENWHNHYHKGFIPLFILNNQDIKIEWHHLFPDLPFVIPIPTDIHQGNKGKNRYMQATQAFYKWLKDNPDINTIPIPSKYKPRC